jgi:hypothetical protein
MSDEMLFRAHVLSSRCDLQLAHEFGEEPLGVALFTRIHEVSVSISQMRRGRNWLVVINFEPNPTSLPLGDSAVRTRIVEVFSQILFIFVVIAKYRHLKNA